MSAIARIVPPADDQPLVLSILGVSRSRDARRYAERAVSRYAPGYILTRGRRTVDASMLTRYDYRLVTA